MGQRVDGCGGVVVDGVAGSRVGFTPGEVDAPALVSRIRTHHRDSVVAFPQKHPQSVQFTLDGSVPLLGTHRLVHVVVKLWRRIVLLCRHHNSSVFRFFQFGSFFS